MATITKRYALHRKAIKDDIATIENEWALGEYYKAGVISADLLYLAVGPIPAPKAEPMDYGLAGPAFTIPEPPTLMAIPDFVAGLLYGITTENHLTEIEQCWTAGTPIEKDFMVGIADMHHGGWDFEIQAILEFGLAALNIPIALKTCEHMGPDIKAIESWATIFEDKTKLMATITKRYALHRKAIKADIASCKEEWAAGEYYKTGVTAADLLYLAVGPIPAPAAEPQSHKDLPNPVGMPVVAPYEFAAGFVKGFLVDNNLTAIETCAHEDATSAKYVEKAMAALIEGDVIRAVSYLVDFAKTVPTDIGDCLDAKAEVAAIQDWATIFDNKAILTAKATTNYALHKRAVKNDRATMEADWAAKDFFQAGYVGADICRILLGPVVVPTAANELAFPSDPIAVPDFVAGFIYGMTGDNDLTEIEACWNGNVEMYGEIQKAIGDLEKGGWDNITQGVLELSLVLLQFPQALNTCENMDEDIAAIEAWAQIFTDIPALTADVTKHWLFHKKAIQADAHETEVDWEAGNYFNAGIDAAALMTLAVGPI